MNDAAWQLEMAWPPWAAALAALAVLPPVVYYWWRSLVQFARWQRAASLAVRVLLLWVLIGAVCDVRLSTPSAERFVVLLVDRSSSMSAEASRVAEAFCTPALADGRDDGHRCVLLPFSAQPGQLAEAWSELAPPSGRATDLAAAIAAAQAAVPATHVPQIVLLCDGNQTSGDALAAAKAARVPISTVPLPGRHDPEVYVSAVQTPAQVRQGEPFEVQVSIESTHDGQGTLTLADSQAAEGPQRRPVQLRKGENRFRFRRSVTGRPTAVFSARIDDVEDTLPENNRAAGAVCLPQKIRLLLMEGQRGSAQPLAEILGLQGIDATVKPLEEMPRQADQLRPYDLLVLANVPVQPPAAATAPDAALSAAQMDLLGQYVAQSGGGLIVIGGDRAFTSGDYHRTKLEEILPVECRVKPDRPLPSRAVVLVVDRSESMQGRNIELTKRAARAAVERLGSRDRAGVIAFEDRTRWVSQIQACSDGQKQRMAQRIATITAAGGTNMYPAMQRAYLALDETFAELKHMIVLTDGLSHPGDFAALTGRIAAAGITVSTVGVGDQAAGELLREIAELGNGRYHDCKDPDAMPQIFALETASPPKLGVVQRLVAPQLTDAAGMFAGLDLGPLPRLLGYVQTTAKPSGALAVTADGGDPLLAWGPYGRGRCVAFTSDLHHSWAPLWLKWPHRGRFWAAIVAHAMRKDRSNGGVVLNVLHHSDRAFAVLDAVEPDGSFVNRARPRLEVTGPGDQRHTTGFTQIAPGRYAAEFAAAVPGAYYLEATLEHGGRPAVVLHRGLVVGYADEFRLRPTDTRLLQEIAAVTGGTYDPQPADLFAPSESTVTRTTPCWPYLLAAAAMLLLLDVTLKRVDLRKTGRSGGSE